ncbi:hypothetical protein GCM10025781_27110 [Kocuria gwangalliensis]|uniref:Uncharacterized protein n=1 Tax=Kocuria gwangalliensis TaxID=501592 RepID=A0ABP8XHT8_9MICC
METISVVLLTDGSLVRLYRKEGLVFHRGGSSPGLVAEWVDYEARPVSDYDVTYVDFRHTRGQQPVLLRHAKGVGVNLALRDVLEGRTPRGA